MNKFFDLLCFAPHFSFRRTQPLSKVYTSNPGNLRIISFTPPPILFDSVQLKVQNAQQTLLNSSTCDEWETTEFV